MIQFTYIYLANKRWTFEWASTGAAYYRIILNGHEINRATTLIYEHDFPVKGPYPPVIEIVSEDELALSEENPPSLLMQWYAVEGATSYKVEEEVDGDYVKIFSIEHPSEWVFDAQTIRLDDGTTHLYSVVTLDSIFQASDRREYEIFVVCPPTPPVVIVTYDEDIEEIIVSIGA